LDSQLQPVSFVELAFARPLLFKFHEAGEVSNL
jgi:hypothetical protein